MSNKRYKLTRQSTFIVLEECVQRSRLVLLLVLLIFHIESHHFEEGLAAVVMLWPRHHLFHLRHARLLFGAKV